MLFASTSLAAGGPACGRRRESLTGAAFQRHRRWMNEPLVAEFESDLSAATREVKVAKSQGPAARQAPSPGVWPYSNAESIGQPGTV